jgi:hypothetical protein
MRSKNVLFEDKKLKLCITTAYKNDFNLHLADSDTLHIGVYLCPLCKCTNALQAKHKL